jgi:hypothetical protein
MNPRPSSLCRMNCTTSSSTGTKDSLSQSNCATPGVRRIRCRSDGWGVKRAKRYPGNSDSRACHRREPCRRGTRTLGAYGIMGSRAKCVRTRGSARGFVLITNHNDACVSGYCTARAPGPGYGSNIKVQL